MSAVRACKQAEQMQRKAILERASLVQRADAPNPRTSYRRVVDVEPPPATAEEAALEHLILAPDPPEERLRNFVDQKREIFMAQLSIDAKKEELQRLERLERQENEMLRAKEAEIALFKDQFRSFVEADNKATMAARSAAETKAKERVEISNRGKRVASEIAELRREITCKEETREEWDEIRGFMDGLTPDKWRKEHPKPEMFFTDPAQMLEIMDDLESRNTFLMQHCQDAEEEVERYRNVFTECMDARNTEIDAKQEVKGKREGDLSVLTEQNELYRVNGDFRHGNELNDDEFRSLREAIGAFHFELGFDDSGNDFGLMLQRIEGKMEDLVARLEPMNHEVIRQYAQKLETGRREIERTEKNLREKKEQEEKAQRAIRQALKPVKKKTGRAIIARCLPRKKQSREKREEATRKRLTQEAADAELFFGPISD